VWTLLLSIENGWSFKVSLKKCSFFWQSRGPILKSDALIFKANAQTTREKTLQEKAKT